MKNRTQPLFSFSVLAFSLVAGAAYLTNQEQSKGQTEIQPEVQQPAPEPSVLTIPPVEIAAPIPEPIAVSLNTPPPPVVKPATRTFVKAKVAQAPKVAAAAHPCNFVCEDDWQESAFGTHYKNCKCK